jgi:hypothetical protein
MKIRFATLSADAMRTKLRMATDSLDRFAGQSAAHDEFWTSYQQTIEAELERRKIKTDE